MIASKTNNANKKYSARSANYLVQVKSSAGFKILAVSASFLYIPLNIHYLGQELYGVWSTILTVLNWFTFFDLGLGNGLRNKIAECLARQEPDIAKEYISSAYSIISLIAGLVVLIVSVLCAVLNWQSIFNTLAATNSVLQITMFIL
jgi:O-antigen/teichoic acid export membrane protein